MNLEGGWAAYKDQNFSQDRARCRYGLLRSSNNLPRRASSSWRVASLSIRAQTQPPMRRLIVAGLTVSLLASACSGVDSVEEPSPPSAAVVPLEQWVDEVCEALHRYHDSPPSIDAGSSDEGVVASINDMIADIETLTAAVETAGIPDVEGGESFSAMILSRLRWSANDLRETREVIPTFPDGSQTERLDAMRGLVESALLPALALSLLVEGDRADLVVALEDPVRPQTVVAVEDVATEDPSVTNVVYEDKTAACERFLELAADSPAIPDDAGCELIPAVVRITLPAGADPGSLVSSLGDLPGVKNVVVRAELALPVFQRTDLDIDGLGALSDAASGSETCVGVVV